MFDMQMLGFVDDLAAAPTPPSSPLAAPASTV
jgi:hypothetical protein